MKIYSKCMNIFVRFGELCKKHHKVVDKRISAHASIGLGSWGKKVLATAGRSDHISTLVFT